MADDNTIPKPGTEADLISQADRIETQENQRYESGLGTLSSAFADSQAVFKQGLDQDLLFSRASDAVGARAKSSVESIRRSLGSRGLNANSGAAQGLMSRSMFSQQGQLIGADRDVAIEDRKFRQVNAATNFANALNLAGYTSQPVSGARLETSQNIFEGNIAREGIASAAASQRYAAKKNKQGQIGGGILGMAGKI